MALSKREIFERAAPATLLVVIMGEDGPESVGSGVVIGADGLAVTNHHVVASALTRPSAIHCFLPPPPDEATADDLLAFLRRPGARPIPCTVGKLAPDIDIAFLHLSPRPEDYPFIPLGDSSTVRPGDDVVCIGNPHGLVWTMTDGSVSARRENAIQISAPISPGNSGGPLLNSAGELIGVNSFVHATGQNLNFARPARLLHGLLGQGANALPASAVPTQPAPRGVASFVVTRQTVGRAIRHRVAVALDPNVTGGVCLIEGAVAAVVLDASFRTYASWWRSARIVPALARMVRAATGVGLPGLHVWLACTRQKPCEYMGLLRTEADAGSLATRFPDAAAARQKMGMDRNILPALREASERLGKGDANLVIAALGDGDFDDDADIERWFGDAGRHNTADEPYRLGLCVSTLHGTASAVRPAVLGACDRASVADVAGFSEVVQDAIAAALVCVGTDGAAEAGGRPKHVQDAVTRRLQTGFRLSVFDVVPARLVFEIESDAADAPRHLDLTFTPLSGAPLRARLMW